MVRQQVLLKRLNIGAAVPYTWGSLAFLPFEMCFNLWWYQSKIDLELVGPFLAAPLCPQPPIITDQTYIKRRTHQGVGLSIWNYTKGATVVWKLSASLNPKRNPDITVSYSNSKFIWPDTEMVWSASECLTVCILQQGCGGDIHPIVAPGHKQSVNILYIHLDQNKDMGKEVEIIWQYIYFVPPARLASIN